MNRRLFLGVDVGTGSARAGLFDAAGVMHGSGRHPIAIWHEPGERVEQSSGDIWAAIRAAIAAAMAEAGADAAEVGGIGFDATCSLVVAGPGGAPLPVGPEGDATRDVIVWMDHRAADQAARINAGGHRVLDYVGGRISPEMQTPKLLWLAEHLPQSFAAAWQFFDLADWLGWRATGALTRSACTVTCKWTYLGHEGRWDADYFRAIGLGALADEGFARIGTTVAAPGTAMGAGLTAAAAAELGLAAGTPVAVGLIDAHAGGVGTVGIGSGAVANMAYVFGTSSCTMTSTAAPVFVPGVWGPYFGAMVPGLWLNEGGQSAAGAAIDQLLAHHPAHDAAQAAADAEGVGLPAWLGARALAQIRRAGSADAPGAGPEPVAALSAVVALARGLHVVPEFLGNRAPFADPDARAVIAGLGMDTGMDSLTALYVAGLCGIGYGLRQIIAAQQSAGIATGDIVISGGAGASELVRQLLADATGHAVMATRAAEPVLLGSAMLGAVAAGGFADLPSAMAAMSAPAARFVPAGGAIAAAHDARFAAFETLQSAARGLPAGV